MRAITEVGQLIETEHVLWITHRGKGRAALLKPMSLSHRFELGSDVDLIEGAPVEAVVTAVHSFLVANPGWVAVWSIPRNSADAKAAELQARAKAVRALGENEITEIIELGMEQPLGPWANGHSAALYLLKG